MVQSFMYVIWMRKIKERKKLSSISCGVALPTLKLWFSSLSAAWIIVYIDQKESDVQIKTFISTELLVDAILIPLRYHINRSLNCRSQLIKSIKSIKFSLKCHRADYFEESLIVLSHTTHSIIIVWLERSETTSIISNNADLCLKIRLRYLTFTSVWLRLIYVHIIDWRMVCVCPIQIVHIHTFN